MKNYLQYAVCVFFICICSVSVTDIHEINSIHDETRSFHKQIKKELIEDFNLKENKAAWYAKLITEASIVYDVPKSLIIAMIATESSFNPGAVSHAGAIGSMQVIPFHHPDNPHDATKHRENVLAGTYVLRKYKNVCGNWACAIKSYNIGITAYNNGRQEAAATRYYNKITLNLAKLDL